MLCGWRLVGGVCLALIRGTVNGGQVCSGEMFLHNNGSDTIKRSGFQSQYIGGACDTTWSTVADSAATTGVGGTRDVGDFCTCSGNPGSSVQVRSLWYTNDVNGNPVTAYPQFGAATTLTSGGSLTLEMGAAVGCTNYVFLQAKNYLPRRRLLQVSFGGSVSDIGWVDPGNVGGTAMSVPCTSTAAIFLQWSDTIYNPDGTVAGQNVVPATQTVASNGWSSDPNTPTMPLQITDWGSVPPWLSDGGIPTNVMLNPNAPPGGTNTIGGINGTNAVNGNAFQDGINALYTAIQQGNKAGSEGFAGLTSLDAGANTKLETANGYLERIANATEHTADNTASATNFLGRIASATETTATNTTTMTNQLGAVTNSLAFLTNLFGSTNAGIYAGTNTGAFTNAGYSAAASGVGAFGTFSNSIGLPETGGGGDMGDWTVTIGGGDMVATLDLNPTHDARLGPVIAWFRTAMVWVLSLAFVYGAMKTFEEYYQESVVAPQARAAGTSILGINANSVVALVVAAAITVVLVALPLFFFGYISAFGIGFTATNIFKGAGGPVTMGLGLLDAFFPLDLCVTLPVVLLTFRAGIGGVYWLVATIVRFIVG